MPPRRRPYPVSDAQIVAIVENLERGCYADTAFTAAGVPSSTFYLLLSEGDDAVEKQLAGEALDDRETRSLGFLEAVKKAEADGEASAILTIRVASRENWQAAAWLLERKKPEKYGRRIVEHAGEVRVKGYGNVSPDEWPDEMPEQEAAGVGSNGANGAGKNGAGSNGHQPS